MKTLRIGTRQSPLALWQAEHVAACLRRLSPGTAVELVTMTTQGDRILDAPLAKIGGKGLFIKELEQGLFEEGIDLAVHSTKDVTATLPEGLHIAALMEREDPHDAFVSNRYAGLADLPDKARVGTSSLRRQCQLLARRPDLRIETLRGNVNTRLKRLDEGRFDAIILAAAGLRRLGFAERIRAVVASDDLLPAVGQGALCLECRADDAATNALVRALDHGPTRLCVEAERAMNAALEGGCQVPIAGFAEIEGARVRLRGLIGSLDGRQILRAEAADDDCRTVGQAQALGRRVAELLFAQGARPILAAVYGREA